MTTQQGHQQTEATPTDDTVTAIQHAEATAEETIGAWPACRCKRHGGPR
ncbi:hypothetical protein ACFT0G_06210 [Streptomyces sp. NPDC057020]